MNYGLGEYALLFKLLSDETRLKILTLLSDQEICACTLLEQLYISQPTLSYHMKLLGETKMIHARKEGNWMHYSLNTSIFTTLQAFLEQIKTAQPINNLSEC